MRHPEEESSYRPATAPVATRDVVRRRRWRRIRMALAAVFLVWLIGMAIPDRPGIPVEGASHLDWEAESFWRQPEDGSRVHKGIDVAAAAGTPVVAATPGLVLYTGRYEQGGAAVAILGPRWRVHTYANLLKADVASGFVSRGTVLGAVGPSNAKGVTITASGTLTDAADGGESHLHYSIVSLVPYPWRFGGGPEGWKKMFYLDPGEELDAS